MPDNKTQILIELQLEMKKLKAQMKEVSSSLKKFKKEVSGIGGESKKSSKEQTKGLEEVSKAAKKAADEAVKAEKKKQDEIKKTLKMLKEQKKAAAEAAKAGGGGKAGFFGSMMAGAGLGGLGKPITRQSAGSTIGRGLSGLAGGALGFVTSGISNAYQTYMQYGAARAGLTGLAKRGDMRGTNRRGVEMGYTPTETTYQAINMARATGQAGSVSRAQQISRFTGMDVGQVGGYMGMIRQAGYGFGGDTKYGAKGREGNKEMSKAIEAGMISGLEKGRLPEFLAGVSQITQQVGGRVAGKVNISAIASFMGLMGAKGKKGYEGFRGARGAAVAGQLNQAIMKPGGGEAGQAMMLQALGFGKPGGTTDYYSALKTQQLGISDKGNAIKMFKEVYGQLGATGVGGSADVNQEANLALSEMTGLGLDQVEKLGNLINSGEISNKSMKKIEETLKLAEDPRKQALKVMRSGFAGVKKHIAGVEATQIAIGGQFAPMFMNLQKLQLQVLKQLAEWLPQIGSWIKEQYVVLSGWANKALEGLGGTPGSALKEATAKIRKDLGETDPYFKGSLIARRAAINKQIEIRKKGLEAISAGKDKEYNWNPLGPVLQKYGGGHEQWENEKAHQRRRISGGYKMRGIMNAIVRKVPGLAGLSHQELEKYMPGVSRMLRHADEGRKVDPHELGSMIHKGKKKYDASHGSVAEADLSATSIKKKRDEILRKRKEEEQRQRQANKKRVNPPGIKVPPGDAKPPPGQKTRETTRRRNTVQTLDPISSAED